MKTLTLIIVIAIVAGGYYYYEQHKAAVDSAVANANNAKNTVVATTDAGIDAAIKTAIGSVSPISLLYYTNNRNYGVSATKNICDDTTSSASLGAVISTIEKYTKSVSCVADPDFPSKSFTLTAPSFSNSGEYYCTDQNGGVDLIPSISLGSTFRAGLACK